MQALKRSEQLVGVRHVEPGAVVAHEIDTLAISVGTAKLDFGVLPVAGELPRVAQQVLEGDLHKRPVSTSRQAGRDLEVDFPVRPVALKLLGDLRAQLAEVQTLVLHLGAGQAGELEQIVDEATHALGAGPNAVDVVFARIVQLVAIVLEESLGEPVDPAQRRSQIVRDRVGECLELLVGCGELDRSVVHQLIEVLLLFPEFPLDVSALDDLANQLR